MSFFRSSFWVFALPLVACIIHSQDSPNDDDTKAINDVWKLSTFEDNGQPEASFCDWFSGFIAGRTGFHVPEWWVNTLKESRFSAERNVFRFRDSSPRQLVVAVSGHDVGVITITDGKSELAVSEPLFREIRLRARRNGGADKIAFWKNEENSIGIICYYPNIGFSFEINCLDLEDNQLIWSSTVTGAARSSFEGQGFQRVSISANSKEVVVWGAEPAKLFIEGFNIDDGTRTFRFQNRED